MLHRILRRFPPALYGLFRALRTDFSFQTQWYGGIATALLVGWFAWPLTQSEWLFLILAMVLLLTTELQNSSVEAALDRLHPKHHDAVGYSKDLAAAAVLVAGIFFTIVVATILISRLPALW